ncbi:MAG: DUF1223 domain-containing protein [Hyphomicrobiales bacterium]|nr:DUF1223 domain-containing protein [Hyphomicrobiales bacterium]
MKRYISLLLIAAPILGVTPAMAQVRGVVEMFTSQGCSSCPPADRFLTGLSASRDVIALSFPVDYWNYIGWKDTFSQPEFTARQKAYARARHDDNVFTPQAVVDGVGQTVGSNAGAVHNLLTGERGKDGALCVPTTLARQSDGLKVTLAAATCAAPGAADVWLLKLRERATVKIGRGENAGRTLTYSNIVLSMRNIGQWNGGAQTINVDAANGDYVVLVQKGHGAILGAAQNNQ